MRSKMNSSCSWSKLCKGLNSIFLPQGILLAVTAYYMAAVKFPSYHIFAHLIQWPVVTAEKLHTKDSVFSVSQYYLYITYCGVLLCRASEHEECFLWDLGVANGLWLVNTLGSLLYPSSCSWTVFVVCEAHCCLVCNNAKATHCILMRDPIHLSVFFFLTAFISLQCIRRG